MIFLSCLLFSILIFIFFKEKYKPLTIQEQNAIFDKGVEEFKEFVKFNNGIIGKEEKENIAILKENAFDTNKIIEYKGDTVKVFRWKPKNFDQFIGQSEAKEQMKMIIKKSKKGVICHLILSAIQGHGKTTLIELLRNELNAYYIHRIGKQVTEEDLVNVINEINTCKSDNIIFFVDEIDSMDKKLIKVLNPIIEQFEINKKKIKPFIFACATISKEILIKNNPDTLDRIPHHIQFSRYDSDEIQQILKQYSKNLYPNDLIESEAIRKISLNCKYNPRLCLNLIDDYAIEKDIDKILKSRKIIAEGLTEIDIRVLKILYEAKKPIGSNALALKLGMKKEQYEREFEPFLYEFGYIDRVPSRIISEKGIRFIKDNILTSSKEVCDESK